MSRQSEPDEGERLGASGRTYSSRSFFLLSTDHPLRRTFIDVIEWPWFDRAVLLLICLNCAFLAVQGPPGYEEAPFRDATAGSIEMFFQIMFTVEMLCKWVAMGLVAHKTAYARDGWNLLDMTVVIAGWVPIILKALGLPGNKNISAIRLANPNPNPNRSRTPNPNPNPIPIPNPNPNQERARAAPAAQRAAAAWAAAAGGHHDRLAAQDGRRRATGQLHPPRLWCPLPPPPPSAPPRHLTLTEPYSQVLGQEALIPSRRPRPTPKLRVSRALVRRARRAALQRIVALPLPPRQRHARH